MLRAWCGQIFFFSVILVLLPISILTATEVEKPTDKTATEKTSEAYLLRYGFNSGEKLSFEITSDSQMETVKGPHQLSTKSKSSTYRDLKVLQVFPSGSAEVEVYVRYVKMESIYDDKPAMVYDSSDPQTYSRNFDHIQKIIDRPYVKLQISPSGKLEKILAINGVDMGKDQPGTNEDKAAEVRADPSMNFLVSFPEEPVTVGATWKEAFEQEIPTTKSLKMKVEFVRTFELVKVEHGVATIQFKTSMITPLRDPTLEVKTLQMKPRGIMTFDINRGMMLSRTTQSTGTVIGAIGSDSTINSNTIKKDQLTDKLPPAKKVVVSPENVGIIR